MSNEYAVFIITHGRPRNQLTVSTLRSRGYTGKIYLVVDTDDLCLNEYKQLYGDAVLTFDKSEYIRRTDTGLSEPYANFAVFARNATEDIARNLGYKYIVVMDDDLTNFRFRYDDNGSFKSIKITNTMQAVMDEYVNYLAVADISCLCFGVHNNYMRGTDALYTVNPRTRLCFTVFFRNLKFEVDWKLNMCEDRITSIDSSRKGQVWLQLLNVQVDTVAIGGTVAGGNSSVYNSLDKFKQTFFPVMIFPDCNYSMMWKNSWITALDVQNVCPEIIGGVYKL